jgi:hypothetical protein
MFPESQVPEPGPGVLAACGLGLMLCSVGLRRRAAARRCQ